MNSLQPPSEPKPGGLTRKDGVVGILFLLVVILLVSGLSGSYWVFGYAVVTWLGVLAGIGFVRTGDAITWFAAALVFVCLALGMTGILVNEDVVVRSTTDTVLGFHPGTAALVYGIWVPGLFTLGFAFVILFDRLVDSGKHSS